MQGPAALSGCGVHRGQARRVRLYRRPAATPLAPDTPARAGEGVAVRVESPDRRVFSRSGLRQSGTLALVLPQIGRVDAGHLSPGQRSRVPAWPVAGMARKV